MVIPEFLVLLSDNRSLRFFGALTSVGALFYFKERIMKKKSTNDNKTVKDDDQDEVKNFILKIIDEIRKNDEIEYKALRSIMDIAEQRLVNTFNEEQKKLYDEFVKKRKDFYKFVNTHCVMIK